LAVLSLLLISVFPVSARAARPRNTVRQAFTLVAKATARQQPGPPVDGWPQRGIHLHSLAAGNPGQSRVRVGRASGQSLWLAGAQATMRSSTGKELGLQVFGGVGVGGTFPDFIQVDVNLPPYTNAGSVATESWLFSTPASPLTYIAKTGTATLSSTVDGKDSIGPYGHLSITFKKSSSTTKWFCPNGAKETVDLGSLSGTLDFVTHANAQGTSSTPLGAMNAATLSFTEGQSALILGSEYCYPPLGPQPCTAGFAWSSRYPYWFGLPVIAKGANFDQILPPSGTDLLSAPPKARRYDYVQANEPPVSISEAGVATITTSTNDRLVTGSAQVKVGAPKAYDDGQCHINGKTHEEYEKDYSGPVTASTLTGHPILGSTILLAVKNDQLTFEDFYFK